MVEEGLRDGFHPAEYKRKDQALAAARAQRQPDAFANPDKPPPVISVRPEYAAAIRKAIAAYGVTPESLLPELIKENRVVIVGEGHSGAEPQELMLQTVMRELKAAGATHFAIEEHDTEPVRDLIAQFMKTGEIDAKKLAGAHMSERFVDTLKAAREAGLEIVAVDTKESGNPRRETGERDLHMARKIDEILSASAGNKVVFLVGALHIYDDTVSSLWQSMPRAVAYLRTKYDVASVGYAKPGRFRNRLEEIVDDLRNPVAVSTSQSTELQKLPPQWEVHGLPWLQQMDYINIYPADA